jgi:methyl-accepting chemotaxis protein
LETENIAAILDELSDNAAAAVGAVEQSAEATRQQDALINQAAESFEEMNVNVNELTQNISEIDTMLTHLSEANNQIVDSITHLSATTQQVTASSTQAENVSSKNLQNADDTKEILNQVLSVSQQLDKYVQTEA